MWIKVLESRSSSQTHTHVLCGLLMFVEDPQQQNYKLLGEYDIPYMRTMVLEYSPTFARTKSPSHVGKYTIHGAYAYDMIWYDTGICLQICHKKMPISVYGSHPSSQVPAQRWKMKEPIPTNTNWLVVLTILKNIISQWEGLSHIIVENKTCSKPPTSKCRHELK